MQKGSDKKLSGALFIGALVAAFILINSHTSDTPPATITSSNVDPNILPSIQSVSEHIHSKGIESGITDYNEQSVTLVNGYPSAEDIASAAGLPEGTYNIDQETGKSVIIQNGDCLIVYTEAKAGSQPEIIDLLNTCN